MIVHPHVHFARVPFAHVQLGGPCAAPLRYHPQRHRANGMARRPACCAQRSGMESDRRGVARMVTGELPR